MFGIKLRSPFVREKREGLHMHPERDESGTLAEKVRSALPFSVKVEATESGRRAGSAVKRSVSAPFRWVHNRIEFTSPVKRRSEA